MHGVKFSNQIKASVSQTVTANPIEQAIIQASVSANTDL